MAIMGWTVYFECIQLIKRRNRDYIGSWGKIVARNSPDTKFNCLTSTLLLQILFVTKLELQLFFTNDILTEQMHFFGKKISTRPLFTIQKWKTEQMSKFLLNLAFHLFFNKLRYGNFRDVQRLSEKNRKY